MESAPRRVSSNRVIFACRQNAGRSQMAAAFFNFLVDPEKAMSISAGTQPAARIHPEVLDAMKEIGVDLSRVTPRLLTRELLENATLLVTFACREACPVVPGLKGEDWQNIADPQGQPPVKVREIRDTIYKMAKMLVDKNGWGRRIPPGPGG
jgi:arsenate reductase